MTSGKKILNELKQGAKHLFDLPIGSHDVPVYESPKVAEMDCWGLAVCHPQYAIFLDGSNEISKADKRRTLLHECLEVANDLWQLELDERGIRVLENAIWQILRTRKL